ncbi:MAG: outer membrane lipoprotein-sorting protein [Opitutales bacterium]|nr:outer membrane lipoprotein-sorting protein [Opitutales bacterium]
MKISLFSLILLVLLAPALAQAQPRRPPPNMQDPRRLNPTEGEQFLEAFRRSGIPEPFAFRFNIQHLPRRGAGFQQSGEMWGVWDGHAQVSRLRLEGAREAANDQHWLLASNGEPRVWKRDAAPGREIDLASGEALQRPFIEDTFFSAFDLLMPFRHWEDVIYEGVTRIRGRPVHRFLFYPPPEDPRYSGIGGVRASIDGDFNAILESEVLDEDGRTLRTMRVSRFRRVDDQWIVRQVDVTDERSRDRTRFEVVAAVVGLDWMPEVFDPQRLNEPLPTLPAGRMTVF